MRLSRSLTRLPCPSATLAAVLSALAIVWIAGPARADDEAEGAEPQVETARDPALRFSPGQGLRVASEDERFSARLSVRVLPDVDLELVTRAATVHPLARSAVRERHELGAGLNWYIEGHPLKVQLDAFRTWTEQGWGDAQHRVRAQLQVTL